MTPLQLKTNLQRFTIPVLQKEVAEVVLGTPDLVFRKQDEMQMGENPDGSSIGEYSSSPMGREYAVFKQHINPMAGGSVDLILTGSTRDKMKAQYLGSGKYTLNSTDHKWSGLKEKYGQQISGINNDFWNALQKFEYAPQLFNNIRNKIIK